MIAYARWYGAQRVWPRRWTAVSDVPAPLQRHVRFAQRQLSQSSVLISDAMRTHQLKLADRQCRMSAISSQVQDAVVMLVTSLHAAHSTDEIVRQAADGVCRELAGRISGRAPSDADYRQVTQLGATVADTGWEELRGITASPLMMPYDPAEAPTHQMASG